MKIKLINKFRHVKDFILNELVCPNTKVLDFDKNQYFISSVQHNFIGIDVDNEFLIYNCGFYNSYRTKLQNFEDVLKDTVLHAYNRKFSNEYISKYFQFNSDNPFAVENYASVTVRQKDVNELTQFPPLFVVKDKNKQVDELGQMINLAEPGDMLFSCNINSRISKLIGKYDRCQFSHCAIISIWKTIIDVNLSGIKEMGFENYDKPYYNLALYRMRNIKKEDQINIGYACLKSLGGGFNWKGLILMLIKRELGLSGVGSTPGDLLRSNIFDLIYHV